MPVTAIRCLQPSSFVHMQPSSALLLNPLIFGDSFSAIYYFLALLRFSGSSSSANPFLLLSLLSMFILISYYFAPYFGLHVQPRPRSFLTLSGCNSFQPIYFSHSSFNLLISLSLITLSLFPSWPKIFIIITLHTSSSFNFFPSTEGIQVYFCFRAEIWFGSAKTSLW